MKKLLYISVSFLLFWGCQHPKTTAPAMDNTTIPETISSLKTEIPEFEYNRIVKISEPFILNNVMCYWEHSFFLYEEILHEVGMKLKEHETDRLLLESSIYVKYEEDFNYKTVDYFDGINKKHFKDLNFNGFKDFVIYSYGSMPMTSMTNIYLFDNQTKTFVVPDREYEDLSDNSIEKIDSVNRILVTSSFNMEKTFERKHHFDNNGKIKFTEYLSEEFYYPNDTVEKRITTYIKLIKGKEVETRTDTIKF